MLSTAIRVYMVVSTAAVLLSSSRIPKPPFRPVFQPRDGAFSIWFAIFALAIAHSIVNFVHPRSDARSLSGTALYASALACAGLWAPTFSRGSYSAAAAVLVLGSSLSVAASVTTPLSRDGSYATSSLGMGLLGGWLSVAATLGVVLARGEEDALNSEWTPVAATTTLGALAVATSRPSLVLPAVWASVLARPPATYRKSVTMLVGAATLAAASARAFSHA